MWRSRSAGSINPKPSKGTWRKASTRMSVNSAQEGQIVVDRHGTAHEDERVIQPDIRRRRARLVEVGVGHFDVALSKRRLDQSQAFEGYVAESQHAHERQFAANWKWLRPSAYLEMPR